MNLDTNKKNTHFAVKIWNFLKTHNNIRMFINLILTLLVIYLAFYFASSHAMTSPYTPTHAKSLINIQHWETQKGTPVYFVQAKELPMIDISVVFDAGSRRDGSLAGLANLTSALLDEGTSKLNANQIARGFETLGANLNINTTRDMTTVNLRTLTKPSLLTPALNLFSTILSESVFPQKAFKRVQLNTLQAIAQTKQQPGYVARNAFYKAIYGNLPYGHPAIGTTSTVKQITQHNIFNFYKQHFVSKNAIIIIVGDLNKEQANSIANQITEKMETGHHAAPLKIAASTMTNIKNNHQNKTRKITIPFPTTQASIRIGEIGIRRDNPDYFPLVVANNILGGGVYGGTMVSKLFQIIREKYGLSYGIGSYFMPFKNRGPFVIALQTKRSQTEKALKITQKVVKNYIKQGPTQKELLASKNYLTGSFPLRLNSNSDIVRRLTAISFYQLPLNYLDTFNKKVDAVTMDQVRHVIKKYIHPNKMITVVVGG